MTGLPDAVRSEALAATYGAVAEWLLYPEEIDSETFEPAQVDRTQAFAAEVNSAAGWAFESFIERREEVGAERYVELFELSPKAPLYLGSYLFAEPSTCSAAGVSDRNTFMLEIANIYRHFAFELKGELPDFLPVMAEFMALTADCSEEDGQVRLRLADRLMVEGVRALSQRCSELDLPHKHLIEALQYCLNYELASYEGDGEQRSDSNGQQLIQIEEAGVSG